MRRICCGMAMVLMFVAAGCVQMRDEYTLNPDGSGKVLIRHLQPMKMKMDSDDTIDPSAEALKTAKELVEQTKGVEVWKDLTWDIAPDGRVRLSGTAYFKNIAELELKNAGQLQLERTPDGRMVLLLEKKDKKDKKKEQKKEKAEELTEQELKAKILQSKMEWQQARWMMTAMLTGMEMEIVVHLPAALKNTSCFTALPDGTSARMTMKGEDMLKVIEELTTSEEFWKRQSANPDRGSLKDLETPEMLEKLFGDRDLPRIELVAVGEPLFDYAKEVAAARGFDAELRRKLDAEGFPAGGGGETVSEQPAAPAEGAGFTKIWVTGIEHKLAADISKESEIYMQDPSCKVDLIGKLPGAIFDVKEGRLEEAVADNGANLLPEDDVDCRTNFSRVTGKNKDYVNFGVELIPLPAGVHAIKKLSGYIFYRVAAGFTTVDVGELVIEEGAVGTAMEATVKKVDESAKRFSVDLKVKSPSTIKEFLFTDSNGKKIKVDRRGYSGGMGRCTFMFNFDQDFVKKVKLEIHIYNKMEKRRLPFVLENVPLR